MKNKGLFKQAILELKNKYGDQGWWPRVVKNGDGWTVKHGVETNDICFLKTEEGRIWEVFLGALLTQNTTWKNVEKALINLAEAKSLSAQNILNLSDEDLENLIKPAGYYRQKAKKIKIASEFFINLNREEFDDFSLKEKRDRLLDLWGVGPETADTILLYGFLESSFVVDVYTRRFLKELLGDDRWLKNDYDVVQEYCSIELDNDRDSLKQRVQNFQEAHALIVQWGKEK